MRFPRIAFLTIPATVVGLLAGPVPPAPAQTVRSIGAETDLVKDPGGIQLLHLLKGTAVTVGAARGAWVLATIDGWIVENALHDDKRDGFDVSVALTAGTTLRARPGGAPLASARLGALFDRVEVKGGWVHVRRTGWIAAGAVAAPPAVTVPPPAPAAPAPPPAVPAAATTITAGSEIAAQPGGPVMATLEAPVHADVVEHKNGWARVRIDAWVRDAALGVAPPPGGISGADVRSAPDKYVGQTVEWTIEVLGIEKADDLRPELPAGRPYLLARGPLPETGFVYVAITDDEAEAFHRLGPLAKIRIRATIRAGKSRFLPTPVLNFVRRLD
jgi:hypothetical protein